MCEQTSKPLAMSNKYTLLLWIAVSPSMSDLNAGVRRSYVSYEDDQRVSPPTGGAVMIFSVVYDGGCSVQW